MRIAVFGAGGVGGYFGGRLAQAGNEVFFIARGSHLAALREYGLRVDSIKGDFHLQPVQASDDPEAFGKVDFVLLATKAWQVPEAAQKLSTLLSTHSAVIYLGNGVEAAGQLAAVVGARHVLGGLCQISAMIAAPGHIRHVGIEPKVSFGELDGSTSSRLDSLRKAFENGGVVVNVPADINVAIWQKFVFIASISGVGAVARAPVGVLRSLPETRQMLEMAIDEVIQVGCKQGVNLPADQAAITLTFIDQLDPAVMASMQRDIIAGRPSELEAQNGAVVRLGLETGVATPMHTFIYACLLPQEMKARETS